MYCWVLHFLSKCPLWCGLAALRIHHNHVDTEKDPYSIKKGFWYAHIIWIFDYERSYNKALVADLEKNPRVAFQHRHYIAITVLVNLLVFLIGWALVGAFASFYYGFLLQVAMIHTLYLVHQLSLPYDRL